CARARRKQGRVGTRQIADAGGAATAEGRGSQDRKRRRDEAEDLLQRSTSRVERDTGAPARTGAFRLRGRFVGTEGIATGLRRLSQSRHRGKRDLRRFPKLGPTPRFDVASKEDRLGRRPKFNLRETLPARQSHAGESSRRSRMT